MTIFLAWAGGGGSARGQIPETCKRHSPVLPIGNATVELGHGRVETRAAAVMDDPVLIAWLRETHDLPALAAVGRIRRERITKNTAEIEQHDAFHLLGGAMAAADYAAAARGHWLVEATHHSSTL